MRATLVHLAHELGAGTLLVAGAPMVPASLAASSLVADGASVQAWLALVLAAGNTAAALGFGYHRARRATDGPQETKEPHDDQAVQGDAQPPAR